MLYKLNTFSLKRNYTGIVTVTDIKLERNIKSLSKSEGGLNRNREWLKYKLFQVE